MLQLLLFLKPINYVSEVITCLEKRDQSEIQLFPSSLHQTESLLVKKERLTTFTLDKNISDTDLHPLSVKIRFRHFYITVLGHQKLKIAMFLGVF